MIKYKEEVDKNINSNYDKIKFQLETPYGSSDFDIIREEICKCILFDLNQAAITLTNHFSEFFMKIMLEYQEVRNNLSQDINQATKLRESVEKYDDENLEKNINIACSKGIITKEQKKILRKLKDKYRNPYSHSIKTRIFGDETLKGFEIINKTGFNKIETKISDSPQLHGLFQMLKSKKEAIEYFKEFDGIVRDVLDNFYKKHRN
jgi:transcriptional regulator NrdR family protein